MAEKRSWFRRPMASCCLLMGITILSSYIILSSEGRREGGEEISCSVTLKHYGVDAGEMETAAAIPLEDALSAIPGISRIRTVSENGRVRAFAGFRRDRPGFSGGEDEYYDAVREAAQRVYETLPSSAQRPELGLSGDFRVPFWTAAIYGSDGTKPPDGELLERTVKPVLSSIEGVGEVEIAGPGIREIVILLDQEKTASLGLTPAKVSSVLAADDALFIGGFINYGGREIPIRLDGRYPDPESLGEALIPLDTPGGAGTSIRLKAIADIRVEEREADTISRLNGKKTAVVSVTAVSGADTRVLSNRIKKELERFSSLPLEIQVLEDRGAEEAAAFRSVFGAALEASLLVAIAAVLLGFGKSGNSRKSGLRTGLICAGAVPLISIISAAILSAYGFPVNRKFLAGLAVGIGGAVDAVILSAEGFGGARNSSEGGSILKRVWPPLISSAAPTVAALLPLSVISGAGDITVIAGALGTVTLVSLVLALTLLPPLFLWEVTNPGNSSRTKGSLRLKFLLWINLGIRPFKKFRRIFSRGFAAMVRFCMIRPLVFPLASLAVTAAAVLALAGAGADTAGEWAEDSVYVQVEFEGGFLKEESDPLLASWAVGLKNNPAVKDVQTGARTGSAYGLVTFDPAQAGISEIRSFIRSKTIPGAFIYIPEPSPGDRIWTITVSGDDADKCRDLVRQAASLCSALAPVKETVLNFKQGGPRLTLVPRRELLAQ
ncbi:MAG: efflux RND transporter permease subunit, partial [Treponema sp.]|nr:efflux RND transporter permease subunit [Treponema sp.]